MPVFNWTNSDNPEAAGDLRFYLQSAGPASGVVWKTDGSATYKSITSSGPVVFNDNLTVTGYTQIASGQASGTFTFYGASVALGSTGTYLRMTQGTNATSGLATLVAGTIVVNTNKVSALSQIHMMGQNSSGTAGALTVSARTAGSSFTITSTSGTDTRQIAWFIIEPL